MRNNLEEIILRNDMSIIDFNNLIEEIRQLRYKVENYDKFLKQTRNKMKNHGLYCGSPDEKCSCDE